MVLCHFRTAPPSLASVVVVVDCVVADATGGGTITAGGGATATAGGATTTAGLVVTVVVRLVVGGGITIAGLVVVVVSLVDVVATGAAGPQPARSSTARPAAAIAAECIMRFIVLDTSEHSFSKNAARLFLKFQAALVSWTLSLLTILLPIKGNKRWLRVSELVRPQRCFLRWFRFRLWSRSPAAAVVSIQPARAAALVSWMRQKFRLEPCR